jgi:hypothetical protein
LLAVTERQPRDVLAVELEEIEGEEHEPVAATIRRRLHQFERGHAVGPHAAKLSVDIGGLDLELGECGCSRRIFLRPIEAGAGEEPDFALVDPGRHPVAVEFDLMHPLRAARGFGRKLCELRLDPLGQRHNAQVYRPPQTNGKRTSADHRAAGATRIGGNSQKFGLEKQARATGPAS